MKLGPLWRLVRLETVARSAQRVIEAWKAHPADLSAALRDLTVTMDRYGHLMPSAFQGVGEKLDALLAQGTGKANTTQREPGHSLKPA